MTDTSTDALLRKMFSAAVAAAHPENCLRAHLPPVPENGRLLITGAGKATAEMARVAEQHYLGCDGHDRILSAIATRHGYAVSLKSFNLIEAGHPVPDDGSIAAANAAIDLVQNAGEHDTVLVLLSGGASAIWSSPVDGVSLNEKQAITRALLHAGARISETNCVRRHLSRIKGGQLAALASPARIVTLAISDVPGDAPESIGSGPTVPDPTTLDDARKIISDYAIDISPAIAAALNNAENETPKQSSAAFEHAHYTLIAKPAQSLAAAAEHAKAAGYDIIELGDALEGEARDVAAAHAKQALELKSAGRKTAIISGGELTVTVTGTGRGGPNQEYALALAIALNGASGIAALAADTDGTDGGDGSPDDPAGALVTSQTLDHAHNAGIIPSEALANNDATNFFRKIDQLLVTGPTQTNVNDLRVILVG